MISLLMRLGKVVALTPPAMICGGDFLTYASESVYNLVGINADGTRNRKFIPQGLFSGSTTTVYSIAVQADGKIVIGGNFTNYGADICKYIARLNGDGTQDTGFATGPRFDFIVYAIAIRSDGKIICGGNFTSYNDVGINRIAQLNADGTLDSAGFSVGTGFNGTVIATMIASYDPIVDLGYYYIGGNFTSYNSVTVRSLARLSSTGALDSSFNSGGTGFNSIVRAIAIQSDGKIICGGGFTTYNYTSRNRIARLNTDGSLDTGFTVGTGFNTGQVTAVAVQADGKIICVGSFTSYAGTSRNRIARLNTDGSLDTGFTVGTGFNNTVWAMAIQADGKIICGGSFTSYNGNSVLNIVRLSTTGALDTSFATDKFDGLPVRAIALVP